MTEALEISPSQPTRLSPFSRFTLSHTQKDLIAGSLAGFIIVLTGHPLDTIKVRMQMLHTGFFKTCSSLVKNEGALALYKGAGSPLYSTPITTSLSFATYESANRLQGIKPGQKKTISSAAVSGGLSGFIFATFVTPIDLIKTRLQMEGVGDHQKTTKLSTMCKNIVKNEGITGLYKGLTMTWIRDVPSLAAQFATFEWSKNFINKQYGEETPVSSFLAGGLAVVLAWIVAYPQDTIKTRIQCSKTPMSNMESMREIYRTGGMGGFWKGISPCLIRAVVTGATRFIAYDKCQELIGNKHHPHHELVVAS